MSDPLKGLGDLNNAFMAKRPQVNSSSAQPQALKNWGTDGYSPSSSVSTRSLNVVQQSMSARLQASFSAPNANASEQATAATANKPNNDFSPENVAKRIMSHIGNYLDKLQGEGADTDRLSSVIDTAKSAVTKGIEDATDKLKALGWLNPQVEQGITDTRALLDDGFDSLEDTYINGNQPEAVNGVSLASEQSYARKDYSQVQFTTQEGDVVNMNLYSLQASSQGEAFSANEDGMVYSRYESSSQQFGFDFSVEGDLNDDELAAIQQMMQSVGEVSDLFYDGDVAGALQKGFDMGFDASQLASFSMSLSTTQSMRSSQAVSAYGQGAGAGMRSIQEPLANYRQALEETAQKASDIFSDFRDVVDSVMTDIMTMREEQEQRMDDMQQMFDYQRQMLDRISQWLMPEQAVEGVDAEAADINPAATVEPDTNEQQS